MIKSFKLLATLQAFDRVEPNFSQTLSSYPLSILYEYNITTLEWNILLRDDAYKSYSVLEVSLDGSVIIVGNIYGRVKIITEGIGKTFELMLWHCIYQYPTFSSYACP